jgi:hypothetical protein
MSFEQDYDPRWSPAEDWLMTSPYAPPRLTIETEDEREIVYMIRRMSQVQVDEYFKMLSDLVGPDFPLLTHRRPARA